MLQMDVGADKQRSPDEMHDRLRSRERIVEPLLQHSTEAAGKIWRDDIKPQWSHCFTQ